ncbi:UNVERIFIED_CONTAM: hypothetical protein Sradi_6350900 [Sesamum radiatum]|uniref:Myb/SANT-like domain-containing protein n=1 Tax=Sesamum radiatum TaxID=300843 RepID=A0AAW2K2D8_SESRA
MVNVGAYKAENGFKPGYLNYVEEKMQVSLPNSGLKAKPHIESRIKTLRRDFNIVYDMLNGSNTSGFGFDPIKKCVTAEKAVWEAYLQRVSKKQLQLLEVKLLKLVNFLAKQLELKLKFQKKDKKLTLR